MYTKKYETEQTLHFFQFVHDFFMKLMCSIAYQKAIIPIEKVYFIAKSF